MDIPINATLRSLCIDTLMFVSPPIFLPPYHCFTMYMKPHINH
jgi:hypothetical protein